MIRTNDSNGENPENPDFPDIVIQPIEDELDLHTFHPSEIPTLLEDYFQECRIQGIFSVRIIHGKGKGILRNRVHQLLENNRQVAFFQSAPEDAGGWGAVRVELHKPETMTIQGTT